MTDDWTNGVSTLYRADAREIPLPDASVHMCVTSPPYWGLRDYGLGQWEGGDAECGHTRELDHQVSLRTSTINYARSTGHTEEPWPGGVCDLCGAVQQTAGIGLEPTLGEWVQNIVAVMREVRRVLRDDGTLWLNLGDAYSREGGALRGNNGEGLDGKARNGAKSMKGTNYKVPELGAKNLMGQPWRVAFALQDDGWILRSAIVWHKPNPMPESTKDRPTSAYEMVFLLAKQARYFYDAEAGRIPYSESSVKDKRDNGNGHRRERDFTGAVDNGGTNLGGNRHSGANARNVWQIPTQGRPDAHFATFPDELPRRCILAGTSERGVCGECGAPWVRQVATSYKKNRPSAGNDPRSWSEDKQAEGSMGGHRGWQGNNLLKDTETTGWQPTCDHGADTIPATVLDPFVGSGTTCAVAQQLGRRGVGLDLNAEYLGIAAKRIGAVSLPLTGLLL